MSNLTCERIYNYGTTGDTHLAGCAVFNDGKQYRFVMRNGEIETFFSASPDGRIANTNRREWLRCTMLSRAIAVERVYRPYYDAAISAREEGYRHEEQERQNRNREYEEREALKSAATDLLALALRIAALNPKCQEIGAGMLASFDRGRKPRHRQSNPKIVTHEIHLPTIRTQKSPIPPRVPARRQRSRHH